MAWPHDVARCRAARREAARRGATCARHVRDTCATRCEMRHVATPPRHDCDMLRHARDTAATTVAT
eukprot:4423264-Prymnesium_polylepis.2